MNRMDDMQKREPAPSWGVLYVLFLGAVGLLWLEGRSALTPFEHRIALLGIVLLFFAVLWVWLSLESRK